MELSWFPSIQEGLPTRLTNMGSRCISSLQPAGHGITIFSYILYSHITLTISKVLRDCRIRDLQLVCRFYSLWINLTLLWADGLLRTQHLCPSSNLQKYVDHHNYFLTISTPSHSFVLFFYFVPHFTSLRFYCEMLLFPFIPYNGMTRYTRRPFLPGEKC